MLTSETKRKIQTLRDILVGKIPTPTGQVEQITLALIYKFMSDIDTENEKDFGKKTFFVDTGTDEDQQFAKYHFANILQSTKTAQERLELYSQGLEKMHKNPNLNETFRSIFKGAFLPYRDPAILNLFLKGVSEIEYTHSEELGNAFEFLLSVMAAQGDAGQFRTPRHIIDFIVQVVDPQKDDTILDPACGTAGFLISAYKHILTQNTDPTIGKPGSALTTKERQQLPQNFTGYDVSHEMVRLSLANMFLHLFPNPQIFEYDTLSDDSRWNDEFSCVLANPPFMTPKGGIKPHKRFQIPANRAEVLFVDYIMEHLTTNGKAGIIVPEGIIFQSGSAYKALRKMMVEDNYLWAVVSLPSGVFQPYSSVKTSILLFDRAVAKKTDSIYFVKVENDGFDLGAQRRPIEKNDLPMTYESLKKLKSEILVGKEDDGQGQSIVVKASKEAIRKEENYSLSGERYRTVEVRREGLWPMVELGSIIEKQSNSIDPTKTEELVNYVGLENIESNTGQIVGNISTQSNQLKSLKNVFKSDQILYGKLRPALNKVFYTQFDGICSTDIYVLDGNKDEISTKFYTFVLRSNIFNNEVLKGIGGAQLPRTNWEYMSKIKVPLPPLHIQQQIVAELDRYQAIIDGARKVVKNWRPEFKTDPSWNTVLLKDICHKFQYGTSLKSEGSGDIPCLRMGNIQNGEIDWKDLKYIQNNTDVSQYLLQDKDVLFNRTNSPDLVGKTAIFRGDRMAIFAGYLIRILYDKTKIRGEYLNYCLNSQRAKDYCQKVKTDGVSQSNINAQLLAQFSLPLPPLEQQDRIIEEIEYERELVQKSSNLNRIFEQKIKHKINELWSS